MRFSSKQRNDGDFYPTPKRLVEKFVKEHNIRGFNVWECACGDGRVADVLEEFDNRVYKSDLSPRCEADAVDFLRGGYLDIMETFEVDMIFTSKTPEGIRRGQTFHIRLDLSDLTEAILLPVGGFYQKTGGRWVYIVDESGNFAIKKNIRINRSNSEMYEIVAGLQSGDRVITSSYDNFGDKDKLILK